MSFMNYRGRIIFATSVYEKIIVQHEIIVYYA
jgi:hypothetical protein